MQIRVKCSCGEGNCREWAIVELQGAVEAKPSVQNHTQNLQIGVLCRPSSQESYTFTVGYHELLGAKLSLKKPILVLKKIELQSEEEEDADSKKVELDVIGVIRHKILFKTRPKAIISRSQSFVKEKISAPASSMLKLNSPLPLQNYPKFLHREFPDVHSMKRTKSTSDGAYTSSGTAHGSNEATEAESTAPPRPQGRDAAKAAMRAAKGKGKKAASEDAELMSLLDSMNARLTSIVEAKQTMAKAMMASARAKQNSVDMRIITKDTSYMKPEQYQLYMIMVAEVKQRRGWV